MTGGWALFSARLFTDALEHLAQARFLKVFQQRYHGAGEDPFQRGVDSQSRRGADAGSMEQRSGFYCLVNICQRDSLRRFQQSGTTRRPFLTFNQLRLLKRGKDTANNHWIGVQLERNIG